MTTALGPTRSISRPSPRSIPAPSCSGACSTRRRRGQRPILRDAHRAGPRPRARQLLRHRPGRQPRPGARGRTAPAPSWRRPIPCRSPCPSLDAGQPDLGHDRQRPEPSITSSPSPPGRTSRSPPASPRFQGGELYVGYQSIPTTEHVPGVLDLADARRPSKSSSPTPRPARITSCSRATRARPAASRSRSRPRRLPLQVTGVSPSQAGNSGTTTLTIQGAEFTAGDDGQPRSPRRRHADRRDAGDVPGQHDAVRPVQPGRARRRAVTTSWSRAAASTRPTRRRSP